MQMIGGGGGGSMLVDVYIGVEVVGGPIGDTDQQEVVSYSMAENRAPSTQYWTGIKTTNGGHEEDMLDKE